MLLIVCLFELGRWHIGGPLLGAVQDKQIAIGVEAQFPGVYETNKSDASFLGYRYQKGEIKPLKAAIPQGNHQKLEATINASKKKCLFGGGHFAVVYVCLLLLSSSVFSYQGRLSSRDPGKAQTCLAR